MSAFSAHYTAHAHIHTDTPARERTVWNSATPLSASKMTTTTMHFGPEWMRTKQAPVRTNPSPPLTASAASAGASSYSALVTPTTPAQPDKRDPAHPFRYPKEDLIRICTEGGGKGGLGLEVERWEGVVREVGNEPTSLKEWTDNERKV